MTTYILTPSGLRTGEWLMTFGANMSIADAARARTLALSLGARSAGMRYYLSPKRAELWQRLYEAGVSAVKQPFGWRYLSPRSGRIVRLSHVLRKTRRAVPA